MMNGKLKGINIMSFIVFSMISIRLIVLPADIMKYAENDAWISVLISGVITYLTAYAAYYISSKHPGLNFAQVHTKLFGNLVGKIIITGIAIYAIISAGISLRLFADSIKMFLLDRTPTFIIVGLMVFACAYCMIKGIKTISITFDIIFPVVFIIIIITLMTYKNAELKDLLPIAHSGIKPIIQGSLNAIDPAIGVGIIAYIMPYFEDIKETKKWIFIATTIGLIVYMLLVLMCILTFGSIKTEYLTSPGILLAKVIEFRAEIFERIESLFMAAWIPAIFANIITFCILVVLSLREVFNTKKTNRIILIIAPFILIISLIPRGTQDVYGFLEFNSRIAVVISLIYIPIFFIIVALKGRGKKKYEK